MGKLKKIPKGSLLTVTSGAYSDYYVQGVFRATDTIDAEQLRSEWLAAHPEQFDPVYSEWSGRGATHWMPLPAPPTA